MGLCSVADVALASKAEDRGFDPWPGARFLPLHVDPSINWVVTWLWSILKSLELSEMRRYISLQYLFRTGQTLDSAGFRTGQTMDITYRNVFHIYSFYMIQQQTTFNNLVKIKINELTWRAFYMNLLFSFCMILDFNW